MARNTAIATLIQMIVIHKSVSGEKHLVDLPTKKNNIIGS